MKHPVYRDSELASSCLERLTGQTGGTDGEEGVQDVQDGTVPQSVGIQLPSNAGHIPEEWYPPPYHSRRVRTCIYLFLTWSDLHLGTETSSLDILIMLLSCILTARPEHGMNNKDLYITCYWHSKKSFTQELLHSFIFCTATPCFTVAHSKCVMLQTREKNWSSSMQKHWASYGTNRVSCNGWWNTAQVPVLKKRARTMKQLKLCRYVPM